MANKKQDGFGNEIQKMTYTEFLNHVSNKGMWLKGDTIQVKNKEGCVISTIVLLNDGEDKSRHNPNK